MAAAPPLGLNSLESLRSVRITQKVTGFSNNKYVVVAPDGAVILYAKENSGALNRLFGGKDRSFEINIYDRQDKEFVSEFNWADRIGRYVLVAIDGAVILYPYPNDASAQSTVVSLRRPYTFGPDKMDVTVCGRLVSVVRQEMTFFKPVLHINDASDRPMLRVKGPMSTTGDSDFRLQNMRKEDVGLIAKRWGGFGREMFSNADNFEITFPANASVDVKAAIIGTCFLIDFLYYEN